MSISIPTWWAVLLVFAIPAYIIVRKSIAGIIKYRAACKSEHKRLEAEFYREQDVINQKYLTDRDARKQQELQKLKALPASWLGLYEECKKISTYDDTVYNMVRLFCIRKNADEHPLSAEQAKLFLDAIDNIMRVNDPYRKQLHHYRKQLHHLMASFILAHMEKVAKEPTPAAPIVEPKKDATVTLPDRTVDVSGLPGWTPYDSYDCDDNEDDDDDGEGY